MSTREEMVAHGARSTRCASTWAATRWPTCRSPASTRRSAARARTTATPCFSGDYPLGDGGEAHTGKFAFERELPLVRA
jgi:hypothetical protein